MLSTEVVGGILHSMIALESPSSDEDPLPISPPAVEEASSVELVGRILHSMIALESPSSDENPLNIPFSSGGGVIDRSSRRDFDSMIALERPSSDENPLPISPPAVEVTLA